MGSSKVVAALSLVLVLLLSSCDAKVSGLFEMNKKRQEEGYYMGEFEFKMVGIGMLAGQGKLLRAGLLINRLDWQLREKRGLIKIPEFSNENEEIEFYLSMQNPKTGAFMDDMYPYCTWDEPTENVLLLIDALLEPGQPLVLKYPLSYLKKIDTPAEVYAYLDDVTYVMEDEADYPQTSFHFARTVLGHVSEDSVLSRHKLSPFSSEWKRTVLQWFYDVQDQETGFWGPIIRETNTLGKVDLNNTASIVKAFVNEEGEDIYPEFPLRYRSKLIATALEVMAEDSSDREDDLSDWHEWNLQMNKGIKMLTKYLLYKSSAEDRSKTRDVILEHLGIIYEKCYVKDDGSFSYYPDSSAASLDGASKIIGLYKNIGAYSFETQYRLWDTAIDVMADLETFEASRLSDYDFSLIDECAGANSFRFYSQPFEEADDSIFHSDLVFYPQPPLVLDTVDIIPKLRRWLDETDLSMGNWTSRAGLSDTLDEYQITKVPVFIEELPVESAAELFGKRGTLTIIGFDPMQVPICGVSIISAEGEE